ncbi:hypothetical protein Barb4_05024 [Bacteroidales bacterium Barb4]|nr:hypothetical protein Barb4_05024 [Bacteroidales bacterium Barb4]
MSSYLLDTHILIWYLDKDDRLIKTYAKTLTISNTCIM